jgi:hypothetical protein
MKQCPICNRTYSDETLTYCLADGSLLSAPYDPETTQRILPPRITNQSPTEILHSSQPRSAPERQGNNPVLPYIIVALLALLVGGGVVTLIKSKGGEAQPTQSPTPASTPIASPPPRQDQSNVKEDSTTDTNRSAPVPPLTSDAVYKLLSRWENAQDTQNFTAYESCYGYSFKGVLRTTTGRVKAYDFNEWMRDRRRMITQPGGMNVDAKNVRVRIEGDTATVEFDQYYRTASYSDWGPKVMKVKSASEGEKIVYEELKASYPL